MCSLPMVLYWNYNGFGPFVFEPMNGYMLSKKYSYHNDGNLSPHL